MTRRRRPQGQSYSHPGPEPGPEEQPIRPEADFPPPEEADVVELHELPADPDEIGPVINPEIFSDEIDYSAPVEQPAEENDLQSLLRRIVDEEEGEDAPASTASETPAGGAPELPPLFEPPDSGVLPPETPADGPDGASPAPVPDEPVGEAAIERGAAAPAQVSAAAFSASLAGSNVLPIAFEKTLDPKTEIDSIAYAIDAFSDIRYGQVGALRISIRSVPDFKSKSQSWLAAAKLGENPDEKKSFLSRTGAWLRYLGSKVAWDLNSGGKTGRGDPPVAPHKRGKGLKPIPVSQASPEEKAAWKAAEAKARDQAHYETMIRTVVAAEPGAEEECAQIAETAMAGMEMYSSEFGYQNITYSATDPYAALLGLMPAREPAEPGMVLSALELAAIAHIPDDRTQPGGVRPVRSRFKTMPISNPIAVEDPDNPQSGLIPLGIQNPNSEDRKVVAMRNSDLDRHMLMIGKTGSGKSELMKRLLFGVARADYPVVLVDPHGQLSDDILKALIVNCPERLDDIIYCDLSDPDFPVAFNPLDINRRELVEPTVSSVSQMLQVQMNLDSSSAPRATMFAKAALTALCEANLVLEDPDTKCTLLDVVPFFTDQEFRQLVVHFARNLAVRQNFNLDSGPFEQMSEKQQNEMSMPINRAFSTLAASASFAAVFSSGKNKLDLGGLVGQKKLVLIKLARFSHQAQLGEFVGALIIPWLLSSMDSWGRHRDAITGEETGSGCRIFVDEAPRVFSGDSSVADLLAEARKWDLGLVMAAQFIEQFPKQIIEASLNNTGSKIGLNCEPKAAGEIARAISGASKAVTEMDMATMPNFHFYGNVMLPDPAGLLAPSGPFSAKCLPMIASDLDPEGIALRDRVIDQSREAICNSLSEVQHLQRVRLENIKIALGNKLSESAQPDFDSPEVLPDNAQPASGGFAWNEEGH